MNQQPELDEIGYWSEIKLEILKEYASAYSTILPVADINRNVLRRNPGTVEEPQRARLNAYWGDDSWREIAYRTDTTLFGEPEKQSNEVVAEAFRVRLKKVAGFARVPKPLPMRNTKGAIVYYLYFASQKDTAEHIVLDIFRKYETRGGI